MIEGLKSIDKHTPRALTDGTMLWEEEDSLVFYKGKLYICHCHEVCSNKSTQLGDLCS